ncbi:pirin family protein [Alkalihalobacillus sp. FSL R5-0424]
MNIRIVKPEDQGNGQFDHGKITEQKPIGFSGEGSVINRLGPLFYWAWAKSDGEGGVGFHPHQGFEIVSYSIKGKMRHQDTLGTDSIMDEGGAQVMQTGSGIQHAESVLEPAEGFQIWFEPHLSQAIQRTPTYANYVHEDFPITTEKDVTIKTIIGAQSPINLVTDVKMYDIEIKSGAVYSHTLSPNRTLAGLAIRGNGGMINDLGDSFENKDFFIIQSEKDETYTFKTNEKALRMVLIEIPTEVDYPLYRKPR